MDMDVDMDIGMDSNSLFKMKCSYPDCMRYFSTYVQILDHIVNFHLLDINDTDGDGGVTIEDCSTWGRCEKDQTIITIATFDDILADTEFNTPENIEFPNILDTDGEGVMTIFEDCSSSNLHLLSTPDLQSNPSESEMWEKEFKETMRSLEGITELKKEKRGRRKKDNTIRTMTLKDMLADTESNTPGNCESPSKLTLKKILEYNFISKKNDVKKRPSRKSTTKKTTPTPVCTQIKQRVKVEIPWPKMEEPSPPFYSYEYIVEYGLKNRKTWGKSGDNKPYYCPVPDCTKSYKNANGLKYHARYGHKEFPQQFACETCPKVYTTQHGLRAHIKSHSNQNIKIKCEDLPKSTIEKFLMTDEVMDDTISNNSNESSEHDIKPSRAILNNVFNSPAKVFKTGKGDTGFDLATRPFQSMNIKQEKIVDEEKAQPEDLYFFPTLVLASS